MVPPSIRLRFTVPGVAVDARDAQFVALLDAQPLVGAVESDHIAGGVVRGHGLFGVGVAPGNQPFGFERRSCHLSVPNEPLADDRVDLLAKGMAPGHESAVLPFLRREFQPPCGGGTGEVVRLDFGDVRSEFFERLAFLMSPAKLASTAALSSGSRWRMI